MKEEAIDVFTPPPVNPSMPSLKTGDEQDTTTLLRQRIVGYSAGCLDIVQVVWLFFRLFGYSADC